MRLLAIFVAPTEQGEIGPDLFRAACRMGLEGLVSKRRDRPYQAGRSKHWVQDQKQAASGDTAAEFADCVSGRTLGVMRACDLSRCR
jgi:ATP-dependent DNA ligase